MHEKFRNAMSDAGLEPPEVIEPGRMHRFSTNGEFSDTAGWCRLFPDLMGGVFGDHRTDFHGTWQAKRDKPFSAAEREEFKRHCEEARRERKAEEDRKHAEAAKSADLIYRSANGDPTSHPYAVEKKVSLGPLVKRGHWPQRGWKDALLVPLYDADGNICTLEAINGNGEKDFLSGGKKHAGFYPIGKIRDAKKIVVTEGVATAAAASIATGLPAIAAMDCANLKPVAQAIKKLAPNAEIVILADNDIHPDGSNPGLKAATEAARSIGAFMAVAELDGRKCDFWDVWHERGPEAVEEAVVNAKVPQAEAENSTQDTNQSIRIETLADLWRKDIPKRDHFLGDGLVAREDLIVFSGPQKKGKSLASLNQAVCLAQGQPWLGFSVPRPIRVGIVQQEIPEGALKERLQKMLGPINEVPFLSSIPHCTRQGLKLDTKDGMDFLRRWLDEAKIDLLQLDPLYTFHTGDENSARDMGRLFTPLQAIAREYSIAIIVIHHHGKPSQVEREGGDLHRGTSLLRDVKDANWTFTRVPANKLALSEPPSRYVYLGFEQRHCQAPDPLLLLLDPESLWLERVEAKEVQEVRMEEVVDEIVQMGGEALQEDLIKALHQKLDAREHSIRDAIYKARDEGLIEGFFKGRKRAWKRSGEVGNDVGKDIGTDP